MKKATSILLVHVFYENARPTTFVLYSNTTLIRSCTDHTFLIKAGFKVFNTATQMEIKEPPGLNGR